MIQTIVPELIHNPQHLPALLRCRGEALGAYRVWSCGASPQPRVARLVESEFRGDGVDEDLL